jgi:hypothetical protein
MIIIELLDLPILPVESEEFGVRHKDQRKACRGASVLDQITVGVSGDRIALSSNFVRDLPFSRPMSRCRIARLFRGSGWTTVRATSNRFLLLFTGFQLHGSFPFRTALAHCQSSSFNLD